MKNVVIFGTAINTDVLLTTEGLSKDVNIVGFIDNSTSRIGKEYYGKIIKHPSNIVTMEYDYVIITSKTSYIEMADQLVNYKVPANKIIISCEEGHKNYFKNILGDNRKGILSRDTTRCTQNKYAEVELVHNVLNNQVITKVPIELLRTDFKGKVTEFKKDTQPSYQAYREPYHNTLFEYISGSESQYPEKYFEFMNINNKEEEQKVLLMRRDLYDMQVSRLQEEGLKYSNEPITVKYNKVSGYFSIMDGLYRTLFLYNKGIRHVYVMMTYDDYLEFINSKKVQDVVNIINEYGVKEVYGPILNPVFYKFPILRDTTYPTRVESIFKALRGYQLKGKKVIDIGCSHGYNARMFAREGAEVTAVEIDEKIYKLAKAIGELENTSINLLNKKFEEINIEERFNIGLMTTVLYWYLDKPAILEIFFERINKMINEMIIWESGDQPELEKDLILANTKFKNYKRLSLTFGTGKVRELGIFTI